MVNLELLLLFGGQPVRPTSVKCGKLFDHGCLSFYQGL
jgi:hypothetical protein